jgi:thermostable 8-oxoguanine DNA glycosylase
MPTAAMTDIVVEIMVEVLVILGIATKEVKHGRFSELLLDRFAILDRHIV